MCYEADGLIFAKLKDHVHNHRYRWQLVRFINAVQSVAGLTACDLIVKRDPCGGNLKSGRWQKTHHVRNAHCWWIVVRNGGCETKRTTGVMPVAAVPLANTSEMAALW